MTTRIRYVSEPKDYWIADAMRHDSGVWVHDVAFSKHFENEAEAKRFLYVHGYDLPTTNVVYETVDSAT